MGLLSTEVGDHSGIVGTAGFDSQRLKNFDLAKPIVLFRNPRFFEILFFWIGDFNHMEHSLLSTYFCRLTRNRQLQDAKLP